MECDESFSARALSPDEVHVWLGFPDEPGTEAWASAHAWMLNDEERRQLSRFRFVRDRRRYLTTRVLVRQVLSRHVGVEPAVLTFAANAHGRPHLSNPEAAHARVRFNISHTQGLIALALALGRDIGVDVENVRTGAAPIDIAHRFFAPDEVAQLRNEPGANQSFRFFEYWTFKEAYIKARGIGLGIPLDKFNFTFPEHERVELSIHPALADDAQRWGFLQLMPTREHLLAVCVERNGNSRPSLIITRFGAGPTGGAEQTETATVAAVLRSSDWTQPH